MQRALALKMFYVRAIPRSGYYSGASLGVRFIALLHYFFTLSVPAVCLLVVRHIIAYAATRFLFGLGLQFR